MLWLRMPSVQVKLPIHGQLDARGEEVLGRLQLRDLGEFLAAHVGEQTRLARPLPAAVLVLDHDVTCGGHAPKIDPAVGAGFKDLDPPAQDLLEQVPADYVEVAPT
jgi:hypothetical protein